MTQAQDDKPASAGGTANPTAAPGPKKNKKYVVATPWTCDVLYGNDVFPDITPAGVDMTEAEKDAALEVANGLFMRLNVEEANNGS